MAAYISFQPTDFFNPVLYNSNSGSPLTVTGVGFQPDCVWVKDRVGGGAWVNVDAARGSTKWLGSNSNSAEVTRSDQITSFDSDGWSLGADTGNFINDSTNSNASWNWKAGTTAVPSGGTITPTACSFSTTSGLGIYAHAGNSTAGATIAHGLGAIPAFMISKRLNNTGNWATYHQYNGPTKYLLLNSTAAVATDSSVWNDTAPTDTLFSLGNDGTVNGAYNYIKYVWVEKKGYSKFGYYTGNGNADGPFIYTGFRPSLIISKISSGATNSWYMLDRLRATIFNPVTGRLEADGAGAESTASDWCDIVSNGFKLRSTDGGNNLSTGTFVYAAFAEFPFVSSNSIPGVAR